MSFRNLSPQHMFEQTSLERKPKHQFNDQVGDFNAWKAAALPEVLATLGDFPETVPLNPQLLAEWEHDGLLKQRWIIDVQRHLSAVFLVNYPKGLGKDEKRAGILCCHGHGSYGKEPMMGNDSEPELKQQITAHNYNYGHKMAKDGFITFAIDWIGFGERNDGNKPNHHSQAGGRDWCNLYYLHATMLGWTSLSINVAHGRSAIDFASSLPHVDKERLGVMGLSGGGTMTVWMTLCDKRLKAAEIICYSDLWPFFGFRDVNYCGMQVAPGLFKLVDLPELQGLIAPRPLLVDIGAYDRCFYIDGAMACYKKVETIYRLANASDRLELDLFPGPHAWGGNKSIAFFNNHLKG